MPARTRGGRHAPAKPEPRPLWVVVAAGVALVVYLAWFYGTLLPELSPFFADGKPPARWEFVAAIALNPGSLISAWFGERWSWALSDRWPALLVALAIQFGALVLGRALLRLARADRTLSRWERVVFGYGVGASAFSVFVLATGLAGWLNDRWLLAAPILVAAGYEAVMRFRAAHAVAPMRRSPTSESRRWPWLLAGLPFVLVIVLGGLLPPIEFDVREYHLQAPKEFFQAGRIEFLPHNVYANMALGSEMLSLTAMVATGDWWVGGLAGKSIGACFALWTAAALVAAGRRLYSPLAGYVAAVVYLSIPWVIETATTGLIEQSVAFYLTLSVYAVAMWKQADDRAAQRGLLLLTGFMAGSAVACKYPAALFVLLPIGGYVTAALFKRGAPIRGLAAFSLAAACACGLWFAKNAVLTGNPVYPLIYGLFHGLSRTEALAAQFHAAHDPPNFSPGDLIGRLLDFGGRSPWHSPLVVPLALWGAIVGWRRLPTRLLVGYIAIVLATWWLFTHRIDRFWVPVLPIAALLAGAGFAAIKVPLGRLLAIAAVGIGLATNFVFAVSGPGGFNAYFAPIAELRGSAALRPEPWHRWIDAHIKPGEAALLVGDAAVFDFEKPVSYNTAFDPSLLEQLVRDRTPEEIRRALAERRIAYVFVNWSEIHRYRGPGNYGYSAYITPELFARLVAERVLKAPLATTEKSAGEMYQVIAP